MQLVESLKAKSDEKRREALSAYWRAIVAGRNEPTADAKTTTKLANLVRELGKSDETIENDIRLASRVARLVANVEAGKGSADRAAAARERTNAHDQETKLLIEQRRQEFMRLYVQQRQEEKVQVDASMARSELSRLSTSEPELCDACGVCGTVEQ